MATLYALAHYDDELFCLGQIIDDLVAKKDVVIYHMCGSNIPDDRYHLFLNLRERLDNLPISSKNVIIIQSDFEPLFIDKDYQRQSIINKLQYLNTEYNFDKVITVPADMHPDHKFLNDIVKVVFRPDRNEHCDLLLELNIPGSSIRTDFNYYKTMGKNRESILKDCFELYSKHLNGSNTWENYILFLKYNGSKVSGGLTEVYNLVYCIK